MLFAGNTTASYVARTYGTGLGWHGQVQACCCTDAASDSAAHQLLLLMSQQHSCSTNKQGWACGSSYCFTQ
jgi:hypothetical protein